MRTIKSARLTLSTARGRLYELDIVELDRTDERRFLVNYRYGAIGGELQEGTRTPDPVQREVAQKIFDSLVLSRESQGYRVAGPEATRRPAQSSAQHLVSGPQSVTEATTSPRDARLLYLLANVHAAPPEAAAKLIWRVGQVKLAAAAPLLAALVREVGTATGPVGRVLPYALYRCGQATPDVVMPSLIALNAHPDRAVATPAMIAASWLSDSDRERERLHAGLPEPVANALADFNGDPSKSVTAILDYLSLAVAAAVERTPQSFGEAQQRALIDLFLLAHHQAELKSLLLPLLERVSFRPFLFRALRQIYKAAEATDDAEVFAIFAERFDTVGPLIREDHGYFHVPGVGHYIPRGEVLGGPEQRVSWTDRTRNYFRRRSWRHLRRTGQRSDPAYVRLASACLLRADEATAASTTIAVPPLSDRYAIHGILHSAGTRLTSNKGGRLSWHFQQRPCEADQREEPFAALWDDAPEIVLDLLIRSRARQVEGFAARILSDNARFCAQIPASALATLLEVGGDTRIRFALDVIRSQFAAGHVVRDLIPKLLRTENAEAVELAQTLLNTRPELVTQDAGLAAEVILSVRETTREWMHAFWSRHAATAAVSGLIGEVVTRVRSETWPDATLEQDKRTVQLVTALLVEHFNSLVQSADLSQIVSLAQPGSSIAQVPAQLLAVLLAAARPDGLIAFEPKSFAESKDPDIQAAAAELLANAGQDALREREDLVAEFLVSSVPLSREVSRRAALAIAHDDQAAALRFANRMLSVLYRTEPYEGLRDDAVKTVQGPILKAVIDQGPDLNWSLLRARAEPARRVGAACLEGRSATEFSLRKVSRIANCDQVIARRWALDALEQRIEEVRRQPQQIFSLLDGEWDDSREAAYDLVRERLEPEDWSPEAVITLCDCTTVPAQNFGRETLGRMLSKDHADLFMMRLSEHPAAGFRLTVARLIREYAAGKPDRIARVAPAIRTILSRVFSSRAAKEQIAKFIEAEIVDGDPKSLGTLAEILADVSATCAVADKARILTMIVQLKGKRPDLVPGAEVLAPEVRVLPEGGALWT